MKTILYILLILIAIFWAIGYFVFAVGSKIHFLLLIALFVLIMIDRKK